MAITAAINFARITSGVRSLSGGLKRMRESTGKMQKYVLNVYNVKRKNFAESKTLTARRDEMIRIKDREEEADAASSRSKIFSRPYSALVRSTKGFLGRLMDFLGSLLVGWLIYNLPSIVAMVNDTISRVFKLFNLLKSFVSNVIGAFVNLGNVLGAVLTNVVTLDFFDTSKRLENAVGELNKNFGQMKQDFEDGLKLFTTPLGQLPGEEKVAPMGTSYTTGATPGVSGYGTSEQQALLKTLRFAEGTSSSYGTIFGGNVVPELASGQLTVQETINMADTGKLPQRLGGRKIAGYGRGSKATGAYQFMPPTLEGLIRQGVLKANEPFTPEAQDRAALALAANRGVTADVLKKEGLSSRVSAKLAPEWASVPTLSGKSYYGQPVKSLGALQRVYQQGLTQGPAGGGSTATISGGGSSANLANAASALKGMSSANAVGTSGGRNGCVWAVNQVFAKAGLTPPWGSALYVPTAESQMIKAKYQAIPIGKQQPGDLYIVHGQAHIGVVLPNGNIISNSSSRASFTWEASLKSYQVSYGGPGKFYRIPGATLSKVGGKYNTNIPDIYETSPTISGMPQTSPISLQGQRQGPQINIIDNKKRDLPPLASQGGNNGSTVPIPETSPTDVLNNMIRKQMLLDLAYT